MSPDALIPCGGCHRHVRASEAACPFCAQPTAGASLAGIVPEPAQRLSRAGVLAFAAAFLSAACPSQPGPTPASNTDVGMMQTIYGGPPPMPPTPPTPTTQDAAAEPAVPVIPHAPVYGAPPPPAPPPPTPPPPTPPPPTPPAPRLHPRTHAQETPHAVPVPAYGISPRPDPGSMVTRYGAPPRPDEPSLD